MLVFHHGGALLCSIMFMLYNKSENISVNVFSDLSVLLKEEQGPRVAKCVRLTRFRNIEALFYLFYENDWSNEVPTGF